MSLAGPMLFDPRGFWGDEDVKLLDWTAVGVYLKLLSAQWEEGSIPEDPVRLRAILAGGLRSPVDGTLLEQVLVFFEPAEEGRLANPRLAAEREEWISKKEDLRGKRSEAGIKSGEARRRKRDKGRNKCSTRVEQTPNESGTEGEQKRTPFPSFPNPSVPEKDSAADAAGTLEDTETEDPEKQEAEEKTDALGLPIATVGDRKAESREKRRRVAYLAERLPGLVDLAEQDGAKDWWTWRLSTLKGPDTPNLTRQLAQLRKLCKWSAEKPISDVVLLIAKARERGWKGFEWSYLDGNGSGPPRRDPVGVSPAESSRRMREAYERGRQ